MQIDYSERIPNNVNLSTDRRLQRALERWQPSFLDWWQGVVISSLTCFFSSQAKQACHGEFSYPISNL